MTTKRTRSRKGAPGIVDVAKRANVSPATVSRFFNSPEVVRSPTRRRIEDAASDLGYIRDRMAGAMHNRFSGTFGLIVPTIDNAIFAELIEAFSTRLQERDRTMLIAAHGYDLTLETA
ncbi:MAG TPA: transcriptional regulator, partial [Alphaproteobacteria bacterium]|nr:transcriptional regulator [Alphaproteobacteria bacterium]